MKIHNPFKSFNLTDFIIYLVSLAAVIFSGFISGETDFITFTGPVIGVTALIFIAKGNVIGQILTVVFSFFYAISSYRLKYYGEMITYLCMSMPIAALSVYTWLKNPYKDDSGNSGEVETYKMTCKQTIAMFIYVGTVTFAFYFILKYLDTSNLIVSTVSVTTSFLASYLMYKRSKFYALAYAANDLVLIILWVSASLKDIVNLPLVLCFAMFFINDVYGFFNWCKMEKRQMKSNEYL